jgi:hypothetical protein
MIAQVAALLRIDGRLVARRSSVSVFGGIVFFVLLTDSEAQHIQHFTHKALKSYLHISVQSEPKQATTLLALTPLSTPFIPINSLPPFISSITQ